MTKLSKTFVPEGMSATAASEVVTTMIAKALKANEGVWPTKEYDERKAFGKTYPKGTHVDHLSDWVQELVWNLRNLAPKPSYRTIAEAIGLQCSATSESMAHSFGRKGKKGDDWKSIAGGLARKRNEADAGKPVAVPDVELVDTSPKPKAPAKAKAKPKAKPKAPVKEPVAV